MSDTEPCSQPPVSLDVRLGDTWEWLAVGSRDLSFQVHELAILHGVPTASGVADDGYDIYIHLRSDGSPQSDEWRLVRRL